MSLISSLHTNFWRNQWYIKLMSYVILLFYSLLCLDSIYWDTFYHLLKTSFRARISFYLIIILSYFNMDINELDTALTLSSSNSHLSSTLEPIPAFSFDFIRNQIRSKMWTSDITIPDLLKSFYYNCLC